MLCYLSKVTQHRSRRLRTRAQVWVLLNPKPGHPNDWGTPSLKVSFLEPGQKTEQGGVCHQLGTHSH